jgi:hypothetical protein
MNEVVKNSTALTLIDGFDHRDTEPSSAGAEYAKFDAATQNLRHWRDGSVMPRGPYNAVDCLIELLRWRDKLVIDRIAQKPGDALPDVDALNAEIPQSLWEEDFNGNPKGP